jgi:putative ATP-grasp target RiPP
VVPGARLNDPPVRRYTYCPQRQIALVHDEDGALVPLLKHTQPGATPGETSGSSDGQGPETPPEEVGNPDYQSS